MTKTTAAIIKELEHLKNSILITEDYEDDIDRGRYYEQKYFIKMLNRRIAELKGESSNE